MRLRARRLKKEYAVTPRSTNTGIATDNELGGRRTVEKHLLIVLLSSSALFAASHALAQSATGGNSTIALDTITITGESAVGPDATIVAKGSRTSSKTDTPLLDAPASVSVVTEKELKERGVTTLDEALAYTPGVYTDIYGSDNRYDFYMIRGFYQTSNGTYRDGLPIYVTGDFTTSRLEPYGMQRIEVLKGSNSSLFGLSGPGGIVNAVTKLPQDQKFGEVYTTFGEEHAETGADIGGPIDKEGVWSYRLTGKWQNADAGIDHTNDDRVFIAPALTWSPDADTSFTLLMDYNKRGGSTSHGIPLGSGIDSESYLGEPDFDKMDTVEKNIGYQFRHDFGNGLEFRQNARYTKLDMTYESVYLGVADPTLGRSALAITGESTRFHIDNQLQYDASFGRFDSRTLFGFDYGHDTNDETRRDGTAGGIGDIRNPVYCGRSCVSFSRTLVSEEDLTTKGVYLQEELTFDDRWILTLGGRYDHVESEAVSSGTDYNAVDENFSKRAGLTFKATDELSVYANYSESFLPVAANRAFFMGEPEPQEGQQYEIGAKYQPDGIDALFTVALFDLTQTNVAQWAPDFSAQYQVGEINVRGVELEAKVALTNSLNLTAAYSYLDAQIKDDADPSLIGNTPELVPSHLASLWVDYTIPGNGTLGDLTLGIGARYVGKIFGDMANTIELPARTVFDAAINYKIRDNLALSVNATNLFDKEYITSVDDFSRTAYYGDRRTVRATLRATW